MIPIHVINLKRRIDRKEKLLSEFHKHSIKDYSFYDAVVGVDLNIDDLIEKGMIDTQRRRLLPGEYGCYLSHYEIYKQILNSSEELHLILEDDVYFVNKFNDKLAKLLKKVKNVEWDIFYLGINCNWPECREGEYVGNKVDGIYFPTHHPYGTHAYIMKKTTLEKIFDSLIPIILPIDVHLAILDIKRLTLLNTIVKVDNIESDTNPK